MSTSNTPRSGNGNGGTQRTVKLVPRSPQHQTVADLDAYRARSQRAAARGAASAQATIKPAPRRTPSASRPASATGNALRPDHAARLAILMEEEAIARAAERRRTRRWIIACATAFVALVAVPLVLSAFSAKPPAKAGQPAAVKTVPAR